MEVAYKHPKQFYLSPTDLYRLKRMLKAGFTERDMAARLKISRTKIRSTIKENNLQVKFKVMSNMNPDYPYKTLPELIKSLSVKQSKTQDEKDILHYLKVFEETHPYQPIIEFDSEVVIKQSKMNDE